MRLLGQVISSPFLTNPENIFLLIWLTFPSVFSLLSKTHIFGFPQDLKPFGIPPPGVLVPR